MQILKESSAPLKNIPLSLLKLLVAILWGYVKDFVFSVKIKSLSHMKESINRAIEVVSVETGEKPWENVNSRNKHFLMVIGGYIEEYYIWTKPLKLSQYIA